MSEIMFQNIFWVFFIGTACFILFQILRAGGFKGAIYGGQIDKEYDSVEARGMGMVKTQLNVKLVTTKAREKIVSIGLMQKSFGGFSLNAVSLDKEGAEKLIETLQDAVKRL